MKAEAILPVELNDGIEDAIETRGQTSDESVGSEILSVSDGYTWRENVDSVEDLLSPDDLALLFKQAEALHFNGDIHETVYFDKPFTQHCVAIDSSINSSHVYAFLQKKQISFNCGSRFAWVNLSDLADYGYHYVRAKILTKLQIASLSDFPDFYPMGVSNDFIASCAAIDADIAKINESFLSVAYHLHNLKCCKGSSFTAFGCYDIYDFAKQRFGFGTTSTKNFLAIYDKFMISVWADGVPTPVLKDVFKDYGYSQLVELASVEESHLDDFSPNMTVKEIRKKKKELSGKVKAESSVSLSVNQNDSKQTTVLDKTVSYYGFLSILNAMKNPYYEADKQKQSARCDAYARAIADVKKAFVDKYGG